ncbi:hypothetical protein [Thalassotalea castellviae]|uniref:DUF4019 domain-containing protein n=1 Tax=Thalassotalea castellviae TaxID=3075612 RepID=A0ABU2ZYV2_9GAMM|nr:hypothetical protein [Thalassotalea sp. W431]MDT0603097.1 hypothetical protein [Thalassotalea sp. W431]
MRIVLGIVFVLLTGITSANTLNNEESTRVLSDKMIQHFYKKEFQKGIDLAKPYWPLAPVELDNLVNTIKGQWPVVDQRFGEATGTDFIKTEKIGSSFIRYYYLHKFNNHAIYWQITFYKPKNEWKVNNLMYLDTLDPLYERVN